MRETKFYHIDVTGSIWMREIIKSINKICSFDPTISACAQLLRVILNCFLHKTERFSQTRRCRDHNAEQRDRQCGGKTGGRVSWITSSPAHQKVFTHLTNDMNNKNSLFTIVQPWRRYGLREPIRETNMGHADVIQQETDVFSRRPVSMTVTASDTHGALISSLI